MAGFYFTKHTLFTIESHNYLQRIRPQYALALSEEFQAIIQSSRTRTKFFDDTRIKVDGTFELLDWITNFHRDWYIYGHTGFLASIKRAIQNDFGVFLYQGHVIGSTHTGILNLGYSKRDFSVSATSKGISSGLSALSFSVGKELGEYLGKILSFPEFVPDIMGLIDGNLQERMLGFIDVKSSEFLGSIFNGSPSNAVNLSLMLFLTYVNFLQYILGDLVVDKPCTLFKLKYVVLYHLASSLQKLQSYCHREQILTDHSLEYLRAIASDSNLKMIKSQSAFRNILVHYGIRDIPDKFLSHNTKLYGLVEYFFDGRTFDEVADILDQQMKRISAILEEWFGWPVTQSQIHNW